MKLHNVLAVIFLSNLHSFETNIRLQNLSFRCFNLVDPEPVFEATGGCYLLTCTTGIRKHSGGVMLASQVSVGQ